MPANDILALLLAIAGGLSARLGMHFVATDELPGAGFIMLGAVCMIAAIFVVS